METVEISRITCPQECHPLQVGIFSTETGKLQQVIDLPDQRFLFCDAWNGVNQTSVARPIDNARGELLVPLAGGLQMLEVEASLTQRVINGRSMEFVTQYYTKQPAKDSAANESPQSLVS